MTNWTLDSINWDKFDASKVNPDLLVLAKTASVVEYNSADYVAYLNNVFAHDEEFKAAIKVWGEDEERHGLALAKWAKLADPTFDFEASLERFKKSFQVPVDSQESIRGSQSGELVARCLVESGTTTYYSCLRDASTEPVFREICQLIAVDEVHHYNLFYKALPSYLQKDKLSVLQRLKIAVSRSVESQSDELLYAYAATNLTEEIVPEKRNEYMQNYMGRTYSVYNRRNLKKGITLALKAAGLEKFDSLPSLITPPVHYFMQKKSQQYMGSLG